MSDSDTPQGTDEVGGDGSSASRAEKKVQSRRRIVDSARVVFFRDGFMAANLDEVAERAGVAKGTLYRYFQSKADLYVAVLADNGNAFTHKLEELIADCPAPEQLQRMSRFYLEHWTQHSDYFQIFWAIDNQPVIGDLPEPVVQQVSRLWEQSLSVLNSVLARGVREGDFRDCDTWEVANILWALANALIQSENTGTRRRLRKKPLQEVYGHAMDLVLRGLAVEPPS